MYVVLKKLHKEFNPFAITAPQRTTRAPAFVPFLLFPIFFSCSLFYSGGLSFSLLLSLWILWSDTSCDCRQVDIKPRIAHFSWLVYCHLSWSRCQLRFTGQDRHCLKVRKSRKQFMLSSILPKNERKNEKQYYDISVQIVLFVFWEK